MFFLHLNSSESQLETPYRDFSQAQLTHGLVQYIGRMDSNSTTLQTLPVIKKQGSVK